MDQINTTIDHILSSINEDKFVDSETIQNTENGISLLALKNDSLLAYVSNLLLLAAAQMEQNKEIFEQAREASIEQRVTLEKGVKGLEAKISYQIDKALRAYRRSMEQETDGAKTSNVDQNNAEENSAESGSDSESDVDVTSFRPNLAALKSGRASKSSSRKSQRSDDDADENAEYVVPKISATMPSFEKSGRSNSQKSAPKRRDFAMEEYIRESGDAPIAEASIGSQIMDFGRGGERTERERRKDREIQDYEESNFTRISNTSSKRARKEASQRQRDATTKSFFGEDWGFLDGDRGRGGSKKRKTGGKRR